jgi:hypothetical protein
MRGAALRSSIPPANARPPRRTERTSGLAKLVRAATANGEAAKPLSPREQPRETSAAARAAVVVGPRAHPRLLSPHRANAAPVRGTRERTRTALLLDHADARARATTAESAVSVVSDIAGNSRLHPALPPTSAAPVAPKND